MSEETDAAPLVPGAVRLCRILDEHQVVPARQCRNRVEIGRLTIQVDGHDRPRARGDCRRGRRRIDVVRLGVGVDEDRLRTGGENGEDGCDEGVRHRDHFVAGPDAVGAERELDRVEAAGDADGVTGADIRGILGLEALDGGAEDEVALLANLPHGRFDGRCERGVLNTQVDERYAGRDHFLIPNPR